MNCEKYIIFLFLMLFYATKKSIFEIVFKGISTERISFLSTTAKWDGEFAQCLNYYHIYLDCPQQGTTISVRRLFFDSCLFKRRVSNAILRQINQNCGTGNDSMSLKPVSNSGKRATLQSNYHLVRIAREMRTIVGNKEGKKNFTFKPNSNTIHLMRCVLSPLCPKM